MEHNLPWPLSAIYEDEEELAAILSPVVKRLEPPSTLLDFKKIHQELIGTKENRLLSMYVAITKELIPLLLTICQSLIANTWNGHLINP